MAYDVLSVAPQSATLSLPEISVTIQERLAEAVAPPPVREPSPAERFKKFRATARSIKVTLVLDPGQFVGLVVPDGQPRYVLPIDVAGRVIKADLACKAIRKAVAAVAEYGPQGVAILLQGQLEPGDKLSSGGLSAMPKTPKPQPSEVPAASV
jgi:hypothetical protein